MFIQLIASVCQREGLDGSEIQKGVREFLDVPLSTSSLNFPILIDIFLSELFRNIS